MTDLLTAIEDSLVALRDLDDAILLLTMALECLDDQPEEFEQRLRALLGASRLYLIGVDDELPVKLKQVRGKLTDPATTPVELAS